MPVCAFKEFIVVREVRQKRQYERSELYVHTSMFLDTERSYHWDPNYIVFK